MNMKWPQVLVSILNRETGVLKLSHLRVLNVNELCQNLVHADRTKILRIFLHAAFNKINRTKDELSP